MQKISKVTSVLSAIILICATLAAAPDRGETLKQRVWMVQVSIPDQPDFSVAAQEAGAKQRPFGVIPLKDAKIPALEVMAQERKDDFVIRLYAAKNYHPDMKCDELRAMMVEPVATLTALKGELITTASFASFGVPNIGLLAYQKQGVIGKIRTQGCCGCGGLTCCPTKGQCLDCSICGFCCSA